MRRSGAAQATVIGWLLVLPAALLLATFTHYPAIATLWSSFFSTPKKDRPAVWIGLDNYQAMMADPRHLPTVQVLGHGVRGRADDGAAGAARRARDQAVPLCSS